MWILRKSLIHWLLDSLCCIFYFICKGNLNSCCNPFFLKIYGIICRAFLLDSYKIYLLTPLLRHFHLTFSFTFALENSLKKNSKPHFFSFLFIFPLNNVIKLGGFQKIYYLCLVEFKYWRSNSVKTRYYTKN